MPAITIKIEAMNNKSTACFNLSKFSTYDAYNLFENEILSSFITVLMNLYMKLNKTKPDAHAKVHEDNSKIP